MIRIQITRSITYKEPELKTVLTKKHALEKDWHRPEEDYETREFVVERTRNETLFEQNIPDTEFDLKNVIAAINRMPPVIVK